MSHTRGGEETYTHFHEQTKSVEKLHLHSETILESSQQPRNLLWQQIRHDSQQNGKRKHTKIVFILRINLEICSLEKGGKERKYDVTGNENKKKQLLVIPTSPCC